MAPFVRRFICILFSHVHVCLYVVCACECRCSHRPEASDARELQLQMWSCQMWVLGIELWVLQEQ